MPDCPELQRITTEYVTIEDRLRLTGATGDDQIVVLWLTQKLLNLLVPQLTGWLERQGGAGGELLQEFAQQAAEASLPIEAAVRAAAPETNALVVTVDIATRAEGAILVFKTEDNTPLASLPLPFEALRQWLGIVRNQYVAGGWPTSAWPAWMDETHIAPPAQTTALH
ncbi:hypothetical protein [Caulobacter sp.]|uniref:hypothetical protein n=1 Tax=Caulobacter sp. TaxID=78 RepID=UPI001B1C5B0B|nr:hypothetical protein [Caulobacter sp.]MBO9543702.1 hypothetical protein [Caulobacter sp.]